MPANRDNFGHDTTTDEVLEGIDLSGKLVLITGGTSGLGAESARALASKGARVIITARQMDKGRKVAEEISAATGGQVEVLELELGSLSAVRKSAADFLTIHSQLDILINNAGIMACPQGKTLDGFEQQFGTNHLGHFLFTELLMPALLAAPNPRVVSLSSRGHFASPVLFDDIGFENTEYDKWVSYGQAKTANALFAVGLQQRYGSQGLRAYSVHPGVIMTELSRHLDMDDFKNMQAKAEETGRELKLKSVEAGAATQVLAATAPELDEHGGAYLEDCGVSALNDDPMANDGVRSYAVDAAAADKLWQLSEALLEIKG